MKIKYFLITFLVFFMALEASAITFLPMATPDLKMTATSTEDIEIKKLDTEAEPELENRILLPLLPVTKEQAPAPIEVEKIIPETKEIIPSPEAVKVELKPELKKTGEIIAPNEPGTEKKEMPEMLEAGDSGKEDVSAGGEYSLDKFIVPLALASGTEEKLNIKFRTELSEDLQNKIIQSGFHPSGILGQTGLDNDRFELEVAEAGEILKYKIKPTLSFSPEKASTSKKEIFVIPAGEKIKLKIKEKKFVVNEKNEFDYTEVKMGGEDDYFGIDIKVSSGSKNSHFKLKPSGDCLEMYLEGNEEKMTDLCSDLETDENGVYLVEEKKKFKLRTQPDLVLEAIKAEIAGKNSEFVSSKLGVQKEKAEYEIGIREKRKLFWIIPISLKAKLKINAGDDAISGLDYSLIGKFFKKKNYILDIVFGPDLVFQDIELMPKSVRYGGLLTIKGVVRNIGNYKSQNSYYDENRATIGLFTDGGARLDSFNVPAELEPGKSSTVYLEWGGIRCNEPLNVIIDSEENIKETNEENNSWRYQVECAPENAPDLALESITYAGNNFRVGTPVKTTFRFINKGPVAAPEFTAFYKFDGLSASMLVPAMSAGARASLERTITLESCAGVSAELDPGDAVLETNEDNNIGHATPNELVWDCQERPDLHIEGVWMQINNVPTGEIHAGEEIIFKYRVKNSPETWSNNKACLNGFANALKLNGQTIKTQNLPKIGCVPNNSNNHPDLWHRDGSFTYTPECNGEKITIQTDPQNTVSEGRENNNSWSMDIVCTLPPPQLD